MLLFYLLVMLSAKEIVSLGSNEVEHIGSLFIGFHSNIAGLLNIRAFLFLSPTGRERGKPPCQRTLLTETWNGAFS